MIPPLHEMSTFSGCWASNLWNKFLFKRVDKKKRSLSREVHEKLSYVLWRKRRNSCWFIPTCVHSNCRKPQTVCFYYHKTAFCLQYVWAFLRVWYSFLKIDVLFETNSLDYSGLSCFGQTTTSEVQNLSSHYGFQRRISRWRLILYWPNYWYVCWVRDWTIAVSRFHEWIRMECNKRNSNACMFSLTTTYHRLFRNGFVSSDPVIYFHDKIWDQNFNPHV